MEAADTGDSACEAIQVGLRVIEHATGIALKVEVILELARHDKTLSSLAVDADTKGQLQSLPLGHNELFVGKLEEACQIREAASSMR